jgi:hypothetical protein
MALDAARVFSNASSDEVLPPLLDVPGLKDVDVAASPEWFGDGWQAFRAELLSPKNGAADRKKREA